MKLVLIAALAAFICPVMSAQKEKGEAMKWHSGTGEAYVVPDADFTSTRKGAVLYCLSNDDKALYVDMKITESEDQSRILQTGLTVWLNADGKSRKELGIRFPIGSRYSMSRGQTSITNKPTPLSMANTIQLVGFGEEVQNRIPSENEDNIRGYVKYDDQGNLIYSLTIPVEKLPGTEKAAAADPGNLWAIGLEYGAPPVMTGQPGARPPGGSAPAMPGGGGGRAGGRPGGGMPPGGAPGGATAEVPVLIWAKDMRVAVR